MNYVYYFENFDNEIIYVGRTSDLKRRMKEHFTKGHLPTDCYAQINKIFAAEVNNSKYDTEICETLLINQYKPRYNKEKKFNENKNRTNYKLLDLEFYEIFYDFKTNTISRSKIKNRCFTEYTLDGRAKGLIEENLLLMSQNVKIKHLIPNILENDTEILKDITKIYENAINDINLEYSSLDESINENDDLYDNYTAFDIKAIQNIKIETKNLLKLADCGFIFRLNDDIYGIPLLREKLLKKMDKKYKNVF